MLHDDVITVRTNGLDAQDVLKRLGGLGRDKPVRAISIGEDLFDIVNNVRMWWEKCSEYYHASDDDLAELGDILDGKQPKEKS